MANGLRSLRPLGPLQQGSHCLPDASTAHSSIWPRAWGSPAVPTKAEPLCPLSPAVPTQPEPLCPLCSRPGMASPVEKPPVQQGPFHRPTGLRASSGAKRAPSRQASRLERIRAVTSGDRLNLPCLRAFEPLPLWTSVSPPGLGPSQEPCGLNASDFSFPRQQCPSRAHMCHLPHHHQTHMGSLSAVQGCYMPVSGVRRQGWPSGPHGSPQVPPIHSHLPEPPSLSAVVLGPLSLDGSGLETATQDTLSSRRAVPAPGLPRGVS